MKHAWWLLVLLAGCSSVPEADPSPHTITDPTDYSYLNGTAREHVHDYWRGQERLEVMDQQRRVQFLLNGGTDPYMSRFFPDAPIPLGTRFIEATIDYSEEDPALADRPQLWVQTQNRSEPVFISDITSGQTITFEVGLADADLPHQLLSAWEFYFAVPVPEGQPTNPLTGNVKSVNHQVSISVEAVRGWEIPPFPGHPDLWQNATERVVVREASGSTFLWAEEPPECGYCSGGIYEVAPDDGALVPFDADHVMVSMTHTADTPTRLELLYHGAASREFSPAPLDSQQGDVSTYIIPVDGDGDGPYAKQSLWRFYFGFDGDGPYRGEWSLRVTVHR